MSSSSYAGTYSILEVQLWTIRLAELQDDCYWLLDRLFGVLPSVELETADRETIFGIDAVR